MKRKNIIYGIIAVLIITGILFLTNKNEKTENKNEKISEILEIKNGDETVKNVETKIAKNIETNATEPTEKLGKLEEDGIPAKFIAENDLPPYPGKDGGPGILGTDVNDNEIRDDLEREMFWEYREFPEEVRNVFLSQVVALKRSLDVGIAIKNGEFDKEALIERRKSFKEMAACKSYYTKYNKVFEKPIPGFRDTKRYFNTKERLAMESSIYHYQMQIPTPKDILEAYSEARKESHEYSSIIDSQMDDEDTGKYDDAKARAFCTEISEKYIN
jgi:hypothetical protein